MTDRHEDRDLLADAAQLLGLAERSGDARYADQVVALLDGERGAEPGLKAEAGYWSALGMAHYIRFERRGDTAALRESAAAFRVLADGISREDPRWPACAANLANTLVDVFVTTGDAAALHDAVGLLRAARGRLAPGDPRLPTCLLNLGRALTEVARAGSDDAALAEAIEVLRAAVAASGPEVDPHLLSNLGVALAEHGGQARRRRSPSRPRCSGRCSRRCRTTRPSDTCSCPTWATC